MAEPDETAAAPSSVPAGEALLSPAEPVGVDDSDGLVSRLAVIEGQPLADRAASFDQIHDELMRILEGGDGASR